VLKLKEKIAEEKGTDYAVENQKLIYAGTLIFFFKMLITVTDIFFQAELVPIEMLRKTTIFVYCISQCPLVCMH